MPVSGTLYPSEPTEEPIDFEADFVSFVSNTTYGKPPIIAPGTPDYQPADDGEVTVFYVNPANMAALSATKTNG